MKVLWHPYLIHLYEIYEDHENIYFVIEKVKNGELFDLIVKNRKLREDEAAWIYF
jgi:5'-AMP-activated protein kinase catalytic alpha subunit